ncbi:hypothetical protein B0H17DRAFT_1130275 [Mycena rosella]|uniref:Uncharacterized protein n=1 Tax=Mycena rosella TaxID=1033263 RepID=A0AAD7GMB7_MYCRO|nr:hypothetical protein B0H17DRAFT_1130275 [Mycena rosella]
MSGRQQLDRLNLSGLPNGRARARDTAQRAAPRTHSRSLADFPWPDLQREASGGSTAVNKIEQRTLGVIVRHFSGATVFLPAGDAGGVCLAVAVLQIIRAQRIYSTDIAVERIIGVGPGISIRNSALASTAAPALSTPTMPLLAEFFPATTTTVGTTCSEAIVVVTSLNRGLLHVSTESAERVNTRHPRKSKSRSERTVEEALQARAQRAVVRGLAVVAVLLRREERGRALARDDGGHVALAVASTGREKGMGEGEALREDAAGVWVPPRSGNTTGVALRGHLPERERPLVQAASAARVDRQTVTRGMNIDF